MAPADHKDLHRPLLRSDRTLERSGDILDRSGGILSRSVEEVGCVFVSLSASGLPLIHSVEEKTPQEGALVLSGDVLNRPEMALNHSVDQMGQGSFCAAPRDLDEGVGR